MVNSQHESKQQFAPIHKLALAMFSFSWKNNGSFLSPITYSDVCWLCIIVLLACTFSNLTSVFNATSLLGLEMGFGM